MDITEQAQQHITTKHSKVSTLFVEALGQDLRIVSWRPGVAGMDSPVHPKPTPLDRSVLGMQCGYACKL